MDAGDGDQAPDQDFEGDARYDDPDTADTGIGTPVYADIGVDEYTGVTSTVVVPASVYSLLLNQ